MCDWVLLDPRRPAKVTDGLTYHNCFQFHCMQLFLMIYVYMFCYGPGVVLREQGSAVTEDQERLLRVDRRFTSFTSWNLDKPPSADDKLSKAMLWIDIAKAVSVCHIHLSMLVM